MNGIDPYPCIAMRFSSQGTSTGRQLGHSVGNIFRWQPHRWDKAQRVFQRKSSAKWRPRLVKSSDWWVSVLYMRTLPKKRYKKMLGNAMIINWSLWWCDCMRFLFDIHAKDPVDLSEGIPTKLIDLVECKCVQLFQDRLKNLCKIIPQYPVLPTCHTNRKLKMLNRRSDWHSNINYQIWPLHFWDQSDTKASSDMLWQQQPSSHVVLGRA